MKREDVQVGKTYTMKVSGKLAPVKITADHGVQWQYAGHDPFMGTMKIQNAHAGWTGVNTATKREVRIRTAAKLRGEWKTPRCGKCDNCLKLMADKPAWSAKYRSAVDLKDQDYLAQMRKNWKTDCDTLPCSEVK